MPKKSAGLLMYRTRDGATEVLLVHPGGPFWRNKDAGAWSIPKGEIESDEDAPAAAQREFHEETGITPQGPFVSLGEVVLKSGKHVLAWAFQGDCDVQCIKSNTFKMEWPPKSGKFQDVPEIDQAAFCPLAQARKKINPAQVKLLERLEKQLADARGGGGPSRI